MTVEIKVPPLGESVSEATIASWSKKAGDYVNQDDLLVVLETEKVNLEVNAPSAGVLKEIKFAQGDTVKVGSIIGLIDTSAAKPSGASSAPAKSAPAPVAAKVESNKCVALDFISFATVIFIYFISLVAINETKRT